MAGRRLDDSAGTGRHQSDPAGSLHRQVDAVNAIRLNGAPETVVLDPGALLRADGAVPAPLQARLQALAHYEAMRIVVLTDLTGQLPPALRQLPWAELSPSFDDAASHGPALAILTEPRVLSSRVFAWYVGSGEAPAQLHSCRRTGAPATAELLALLGTALVQERAGIAFRAAGAGREIPREAPFDRRILDGIARAVAPHPPPDSAGVSPFQAEPVADMDGETDRLIAAALSPIFNAQAANGALAAAPPPSSPSNPNYWFFWQRDAGQVILVLSELVRRQSDDGTHDRPRASISRYLDFVEALPRQDRLRPGDLGISRFTMDGGPIRSYGNPQKDGPAHTVLAVAAAEGDSARAFRLSRPYLEYLYEHIFGPSFDPWEFAVGGIFFDYNLARKALRRGARLAAEQGDHVAAERYGTRAQEVEQALTAFADPSTRYILAGRNYLQPFLRTISGLDVGVVGSVLTAYDPTDDFLNLDHPLIRGTMEGLEAAFAERWPVNMAWRAAGGTGIGIGRFPEDANDGAGSTGGNPWTFATLWAAQYYLRLAERLNYTGGKEGRMSRREDLLNRADGYLRFVLSQMRADALTEQIDGQTGGPRGAPQLAWAQAALVGTLLLRREVRSSDSVKVK